MPRICQVMECTIGGTRRHIGDLSAGLVRRGFEVTLVASAVRDPTFRDDLRRLADAGVEVVELPMVREIRPLPDARHQWALTRLFARERFDLIHTHSSKAGALGRVAARLARVTARLVHTPHTFAFNFTDQFSARRTRFFLQVERTLGARTDRLVHVSESERREAAEFEIVPPARAVVIPNGIDPAAFAAADGGGVRAELGLAPDAPLVGTVGLLNAAKGHADLIDAAVAVRRDVPGCVFVVAGEGELRGDLEARVRDRGLGDAFRLLGYRTDVPEVVAALDLFVLPSLWEGLPYVVIEAMAAGKAVVATDVNGSRDLVVDGETGALVPTGSPDRLAAAIVRLMRDADARRAYGEAGRARARESFSVDAMLDGYVRMYGELLGGGA